MCRLAGVVFKIVVCQYQTLKIPNGSKTKIFSTISLRLSPSLNTLKCRLKRCTHSVYMYIYHYYIYSCLSVEKILNISQIRISQLFYLPPFIYLLLYLQYISLVLQFLIKIIPDAFSLLLRTNDILNIL